MCYRAETFTVQNNNISYIHYNMQWTVAWTLYKDEWPETLRRWKQKYEGFTNKTKSNVYSIITSPFQSWIMKWMHLTYVTNLIKLQNMWGHKHSWNLHNIYLNDSATRFFASGFFHESSSPKPLKITVGSFRIFSKIRGDIRKSRCTTGINDIGGNLPPLSRTPAVNLPPAGCSIACTVHGRFYGMYCAGVLHNL
jgi:hypothetical protein